jgi:hypothetical protein
MDSHLALALVLSFSLAAQPARAASAPAPLPQSAPVNAFHCQRFFLYRGKAIPCDSHVAQDGQGLLEIMKDVPEAADEIRTYQANRTRQRLLAYTGTAGAMIAIVGLFLSRKHQYEDKTIDPTGEVLRTFGLIGFGVMGLSLGIGLSTLSSNERHIDNAIQIYNEARPKDPIQLQFSVALP